MADTSALPPSPWELAAEAIAVKMRWFGLLVGYFLVNVADNPGYPRAILNAILTLGATYALLDTGFSLRGRVFLGRYPLAISFMEALFIGILCYFSGGLESLFRYYYFLSLICCAIRYDWRVTYATCALHCGSFASLYFCLPVEQRSLFVLAATLVVLGWLTWASSAFALLLKRVGDHLGRLNHALQQNQVELESRIAERTRQLQEAQAQMLHQEKMAAFGLLAAGIAHEVGNPLTSISSLVQMLERRDCDAYAREKLGLVSGQLQRIQTTLRELVNFSRPASADRTWCSAAELAREAWNIAKYYKLAPGRKVQINIAADLPTVFGVRDQLVQVLLNLILNAMDATKKGGTIDVRAQETDGVLEITVSDDGSGIAAENAEQLFQPYFTTKRRGTGLGLFVCRKLVVEHGGTIECESAPGQGAVFRVALPLACRGTTALTEVNSSAAHSGEPGASEKEAERLLPCPQA
jgi:signal transduction histidine kinase